MDEYNRAICALPVWLARPLAEFPVRVTANVQEVRLRTGCEVAITLQGQQRLVHTLPECPQELRTLRLTPLQMGEIFYALCAGSVHTHETELAEGYLTTSMGCRVGIAGQYVQRPGQLLTLQQVTSFNFRVARSVQAVLPETLERVLETHFIGLLLVGEPGSGKTTLLRQIATVLAEQQKLVTVVDERGELFPAERSTPPLECLRGINKAKAVQMALRTLAPQVIVLDELGGLEEVTALEQGFFGGVDFIASIHASSAEEALCRPQVQHLLQRKMLRCMAILAGRKLPGRIQSVRML